MSKENKSFMYGATILIAANLIVKLIGAAFKIPLTYLLGEAGMGLFTTAYTIYTWLFVVATAGFPVAISKMVAESTALGRKREAKKTFHASVILLSVIGIAGSVLLFFGARWLATLMDSPLTVHGIKYLAPAILFVSFMSAFRGFFQGQQNMLPTGLSEVVEALGKLVIGYALAYLLIGRGIEYGAAGAVFGVSMGAGLGAIILAGIYLGKKKSRDCSGGVNESAPMGAIMKKMAVIAIPITVGASVFTLTTVIDALMVMRRLQTAGFDYGHALKLWGSYSGYAVPLFNMPPTIITAISISLVPAIASAFITKNYQKAQDTTVSAIRITALFTLPCAAGLSLLSAPILSLVYNNANASSILSILGIAVVFVSLVSVTSAILQATGKVMIPVVHMIIGGVIKVIINYFLVGNPQINILGAPVGTNVCYIVILVLNLWQIKKALGTKYSISDLIIRPLISVTAMGAAVLLAFKAIEGHGRLLDAAVPIAAGAVVYIAMLFIVRAIKAEDIKMLPMGDKLLSVCQKLKLIKG